MRQQRLHPQPARGDPVGQLAVVAVQVAGALGGVLGPAPLQGADHADRLQVDAQEHGGGVEGSAGPRAAEEDHLAVAGGAVHGPGDDLADADGLHGDARPLAAGPLLHRLHQVLARRVDDALDAALAGALEPQAGQIGHGHFGARHTEELGGEVAHQAHADDEDRVPRLHRGGAQGRDGHAGHAREDEVLPRRSGRHGQGEAAGVGFGVRGVAGEGEDPVPGGAAEVG